MVKKWKLTSTQIDFCLKAWFQVASDPLFIIKDISINILLDEDGSQDLTKIPNTKVFQSCSRGNFHTWYASLMGGLCQYVHRNVSYSCTQIISASIIFSKICKYIVFRGGNDKNTNMLQKYGLML